MMQRIKDWLLRRFLPEWCRQELLEENRRLRQKLEEQRQKTARLESYLSGLEAGMRAQRRVVIQNRVEREKDV